MKLPGFTAEASLDTSTQTYKTVYSDTSGASEIIVPSLTWRLKCTRCFGGIGGIRLCTGLKCGWLGCSSTWWERC